MSALALSTPPAKPPPIPVTAPAKPPPVSKQPKSANRREWLFRLVIVTALCGGAVLSWWTFKVRLLPLQKQSRELTVTVSRLSTEVDQLEREWPQPKQEELSNRLAQAHAQLFDKQTAVEAWLSQVKGQANPLLLDTKAALSPAMSKLKGEEEVAVIPATISVGVRPVVNEPTKESAYQRVLRLAQRLSAPHKRSDLTALTVVGGTNAVSSAELVFHLWAGQGGKL